MNNISYRNQFPNLKMIDIGNVKTHTIATSEKVKFVIAITYNTVYKDGTTIYSDGTYFKEINDTTCGKITVSNNFFTWENTMYSTPLNTYIFYAE